MEEVIKKRGPRTTNMQDLAADVHLRAMMDGKPLTKREVLRRAGYGIGMQNAPQLVYDTEGFKKALREKAEFMKIDLGSRMLRMGEILWKGKDRDSLTANDQIGKMLGDLPPEQKEINDLREVREQIIRPE